ncbi:MAG TPA: protoporphyrinogen oxidase, partial [Anaerolineae bacterium]|nr:protoporphyrinogen oxidase [Anaerolineae bacterium]
VHLAGGEVLGATAVILATPAFVTAKLVAELDEVLAEAHAAIPYASSVIVTLAYDEEALGGPLDGFGYVIPRAEDKEMLACTWTSTKWDNRAPEGGALIRVYMGRYGEADMVGRDDETLVALAEKELGQTLGIEAEPLFHRVVRWERGMPQYNLGHVDILARIEARLATYDDLAVAGAAYRGVGIPDCIGSGDAAARAVWVG